MTCTLQCLIHSFFFFPPIHLLHLVAQGHARCFSDCGPFKLHIPAAQWIFQAILKSRLNNSALLKCPLVIPLFQVFFWIANGVALKHLLLLCFSHRCDFLLFQTSMRNAETRAFIHEEPSQFIWSVNWTMQISVSRVCFWKNSSVQKMLFHPFLAPNFSATCLRASHKERQKNWTRPFERHQGWSNYWIDSL